MKTWTCEYVGMTFEVKADTEMQAKAAAANHLYDNVSRQVGINFGKIKVKERVTPIPPVED